MFQIVSSIILCQECKFHQDCQYLYLSCFKIVGNIDGPVSSIAIPVSELSVALTIYIFPSFDYPFSGLSVEFIVLCQDCQ